MTTDKLGDKGVPRTGFSKRQRKHNMREWAHAINKFLEPLISSMSHTPVHPFKWIQHKVGSACHYETQSLNWGEGWGRDLSPTDDWEPLTNDQKHQAV